MCMFTFYCFSIYCLWPCAPSHTNTDWRRKSWIFWIYVYLYIFEHSPRFYRTWEPSHMRNLYNLQHLQSIWAQWVDMKTSTSISLNFQWVGKDRFQVYSCRGDMMIITWQQSLYVGRGINFGNGHRWWSLMLRTFGY